MKLDPPATIVHNTLRGVSMGTLIVRITDAQGFLHGMLLPAMNVPGLGHHLFSGGTAELKGINTVIAKESYLDVGQFKLPLRKDTECPTINYLDLELAPRGNYEKETAFPTRVISGHTIPTGSALASRLLRSGAVGAVAPLATAARPLIATFTAASGLPALQTTAYRVCRIRGGTIGATSTSTGTTSFAAPTIAPGLATATTTAIHRRYRHLSWRRRGANIFHQRLEHPNECIADYYRDYCKTTAVVQQFSSNNTPNHDGPSERDGRTVMDVAQCMLTELHSTTRLAKPSVATRRTTGCSANTSTCFSCGLLGPVHMGTVKHIWRQPCGTTQSPHQLHSRKINFELISFSDASYSTGNPEKAKSTSGSMHFLSGGSFTPALASSAKTKGFCS